MRVERFLVSVPLLTLLAACGPKAVETTSTEIPKEPVEARASVDRAVATTGDLVTYTVTVDHQAGLEVEIPEIGAEIAGFRIVDLGREETVEQGDRRIEERWYQLRADLVGSYVLPPVEVVYHASGEPESEVGRVTTSELFIEVASVLPEGEEVSDIRDLKALRPPARARLWPWAAGGGGLLALLLVAWYLWRRRRARTLVPPRPAHEIAFEALDALRSTDFEDPEAVRRYFFALSEVVRGYVEGRWELNATDLTTEEILIALEEWRPMSGPHAELLQRFLLETDRVKFAAHVPSSEEIREAYEEALSFVELTRPTVEEPLELAA